MRKALGEEKAQARLEAVNTIKRHSGKSIHDLKDGELKDVLAAVLQLMGLADKDGKIK